MARSIANLAVSITANPTAFTKGMKRVTRAVNRFGKRLKNLRSSLTPFSRALTKIGALGTAVAGGGLTILVKRAFELNDALAKTSAKLGIATEALAAFNLAGSEAGLSSEEVNKGLENMARNISEAATGVGEAVDAFKGLGLDPEFLRSQDDAVKNYTDIRNAVASIGNQADRIAFMRDIFGRPGGKFLNLYAGAMEEAAMFTQQAGTAISNIDARMIEQANDMAGRLKEAFRGMASQLSVQLAPIVERISVLMTDWLIDSQSGVRNLVGTFFSGFKSIVNGPLGLFIDALDALKFGFDLIRGGFNVLIEALLKGFRKVLELAARLPDALGGEGFKSAAEFVGEFETEFGNRADDLADALNKSLTGPSTREALSDWADEAETTIRRVQDNARAAAEESFMGPDFVEGVAEGLVQAAKKATKKMKSGTFGVKTAAELGVGSAASLASANIPIFNQSNKIEIDQLRVLKNIDTNTRNLSAGLA